MPRTGTEPYSPALLYTTGNQDAFWAVNLRTGWRKKFDNATAPTTDGRYIVWIDRHQMQYTPRERQDLWGHDMATDTLLPVAVDAGINDFPMARNGNLVWLRRGALGFAAGDGADHGVQYGAQIMGDVRHRGRGGWDAARQRGQSGDVAVQPPDVPGEGIRTPCAGPGAPGLGQHALEWGFGVAPGDLGLAPAGVEEVPENQETRLPGWAWLLGSDGEKPCSAAGLSGR
jgi:hypothetical protein